MLFVLGRLDLAAAVRGTHVAELIVARGCVLAAWADLFLQNASTDGFLPLSPLGDQALVFSEFIKQDLPDRSLP